MAKTAKFWVGAALALTLPLAAGAADVTAETVVATVNGQDITLGHLLVLKDRLPPQYQSLPPDVLYSGLIDQIVQQKVMADSVGSELTRAEAIAKANEETAFLAGVALDRLAAGAATEEAVRAAYERDFAAAEPAKEFHAAHILVQTEEEALELRGQIESGASFADVANEKTQDPSGRGSGGDLGWFGLGMMVPEFETAVVALQPGELSQPVQTQFGWHLIHLAEVRNAAVPTLEEVRDEIAGRLQQETIETRIDELTAAATITRTEGIDPAVIADSSLLGE